MRNVDKIFAALVVIATTGGDSGPVPPLSEQSAKERKFIPICDEFKPDAQDHFEVGEVRIGDCWVPDYYKNI